MKKQPVFPDAPGIDLDSMTVASAATAMARGQISAEELMIMVLQRTAETEPVIHAYSHLEESIALEAARKADKYRADGHTCGPLHGIPVGVKDLIATENMPTSAGSAALAGHRPTQDAEAVRRLRAAGAIVIGKHRTHEFGLGMDEPPTRYPWDLTRYPGGSTVGGSVSVAVGSSLAALGTDGGGSIRKPASLNGLVGLKPTSGAVSTEGVVPGSTTVDHLGWLTRSVTDSATLFNALSDGHVDLEIVESGVEGLRLGVPIQFFTDVEPEIAELIRAALEALRSAGAILVEVDLQVLDGASQVHEVLMSGESYRIHKLLLEEHGEKYHPGSREALLSGSRFTDDELDAAREARIALRAALEGVFADQQLDALCGPTLQLSAVPLSEMVPQEMLPQYCRFTLPFNVTGSPALSVPCGLGRHDLPVGLQVVGRIDDEETVLRVGRAVEQEQLWSVPRLQHAEGALLGTDNAVR